MVLNVDNSSLGNPGPAGFDGLLRTREGKWCGRFYDSIGTSDSLRAELAGIFFDLSMAWDTGVRSLVCYSNSQMVVELAKAQ